MKLTINKIDYDLYFVDDSLMLSSADQILEIEYAKQWITRMAEDNFKENNYSNLFKTREQMEDAKESHIKAYLEDDVIIASCAIDNFKQAKICQE